MIDFGLCTTFKILHKNNQKNKEEDSSFVKNSLTSGHYKRYGIEGICHLIF